MKIIVMDSYDSFSIVVDGERFLIGQEDTREKLVDILRKIAPDADVSYEEEC